MGVSVLADGLLYQVRQQVTYRSLVNRVFTEQQRAAGEHWRLVWGLKGRCQNVGEDVSDDKAHLPYTVQRWAWVQEGNTLKRQRRQRSQWASLGSNSAVHIVTLHKSLRLPFFEDISHFLCLSLSLASCHVLEWLPHRHGCSTWAHSHSWLDQWSLTLHLEFGLRDKVSRWLKAMCPCVWWTLRAGRAAPVLSCSSILSVGSGRHSVSFPKTSQQLTFFLLRLVWLLLLAIQQSH